MLGVILESDLSWNDHITSAAKSAACKFGFLFRARRFFKYTQLFMLYKARFCLYGSHLWKAFSCQPGGNSESNYQINGKSSIN